MGLKMKFEISYETIDRLCSACGLPDRSEVLRVTDHIAGSVARLIKTGRFGEVRKTTFKNAMNFGAAERAGERDMGLKSELTTFLKQIIDGPMVAEALGNAEAQLKPLCTELRRLEVDCKLPKDISPILFPSVALVEGWFHSKVKNFTGQLSLESRKMLNQHCSELENDFRADDGRRFLSDLGIPWNSDCARLARLFFRNLQVARQSVLSPEERRMQELEDLVEQVTRERDEKQRALEVAAENYMKLQQEYTNLDREVPRMQEQIEKLAQRIDQAASKAPPTQAARPPAERPVGPPLTPTQLALAQLLASVYEDREVKDREAQSLARKSFATLYERLDEEEILDEDPDKLWAEQLAMLRMAFDRSNVTISSLQRKTGLSADAITPLVHGRATQGSHVNSVVRLSKELNVVLAGITSFIERSPPAADEDSTPTDQMQCHVVEWPHDHKLH